MNLMQLKAFVATISNLVSMELLIGVIVLALFYGTRFNAWSEKEAEYGRRRPPRQFTTWGRFVSYATLYLCLVQSVYLLLVASPHLIQFIGGALKSAPAAELSRKQTDQTFPLWVMVFMMSAFAHLPGFRQLEENFRQWFHERAFIPYVARSLITSLIENPAFFKPDPGKTRKVVEKFGKAMPRDWGERVADNRLSSKWFRLAYLQEMIAQWSAHPQIQRYLSHCGDEYKIFKEQFKQLSADIGTHFERAPDEDGPAADQDAVSTYIQSVRNNLHRETSKLTARIYEFIVCGALATERVHRRRVAILNYFGLYPTYEPGIPIILDIVFKNAVIVFGLVAATSIGYLWYLRSAMDATINIAMGIVWAVIALLMIGLSIFCAVVVYRLLTRKSRFRTVETGGVLVVGAFVHQCIGFATGYLCGLAVMMPYNAIGSEGMWLKNLQHALPWSMIPAITASYVVYYLADLKKRRSRIKDATVQGVATGLIGLLACVWAFDTLTTKTASMIYIISTSIGLGAVIGYFFPTDYHDRMAAMYLGPERRTNPRIFLSAQSGLKADGQQIACHTEDLSLGGAALNVSCKAEVGDRVELDLPGVGLLGSAVVRKNDRELAVRFEDDKGSEPLLRAYIGQMA